MITALRILAAADRPLRAPTATELLDAEHWWFTPATVCAFGSYTRLPRY